MNQRVEVLYLDLSNSTDRMAIPEPLILTDTYETTFTWPLNIVADMLRLHARQLIMNQTAGNQTR
jgi:hypothetical protein